MLASARLGKKFDLNGHTAVDWARYLIFVLGMEIESPKQLDLFAW
jgi:hypothetical protein